MLTRRLSLYSLIMETTLAIMGLWKSGPVVLRCKYWTVYRIRIYLILIDFHYIGRIDSRATVGEGSWRC